MRITILTVGSLGDLEPLLALGAGLRAAGHPVTVATYAYYRPRVESLGLGFAELPGDPRRMIESDHAREIARAGTRRLRYLHGLWQQARAVRQKARGFLDRCLEVCRDAEMLVYTLTTAMGDSIAERLDIPCVQAYLHPVTPTRAFPSFLAPQRERSPLYHLGSHLVAEQILWQPFRGILNGWRRECLGLPPIPVGGPLRRANRRRIPLLYGFSAAVVPKPDDWGDWIHVTGYWHPVEPAGWQPPPDLADFLAAGPPPVFVGFGSAPDRDRQALGRTVLEALSRAGRRGVIQAGWTGLKPEEVPAGVRLIEEVPHGWLFPRMAAVVHHGGAGTTAMALRSGAPAVVVPFMTDGPFWARRCEMLGVAPSSIPRRHLRAESLASAIQSATEDASYRRNAERIASRLREEDGVLRALEIVQSAERGHPMSRTIDRTTKKRDALSGS